MGQAPPCYRQSRMAHGRFASPRRLCRQQPTYGAGLDHTFLQSTWYRRAAHQGRQAGDQLDTIVVQWHGAERSPTSASRIGLQSRCVPARHRPSRADSRLVADQPANSADQNWRKGCASRPCNHLPTRRRYSQWRSVQPHPCGYPTAARTAGS